jgi:hypothetical protein
MLALPGCGTSGIPRLQPGPDWHIQQGQAVWRPNRTRPELSGELVLARQGDGSSVFNFSKTPLPVAAGQTTLTNWLIEFPAQHLAFGGKGAPPVRFTWLYLTWALAGEPLPPHLRFVPNADGRWRLENLKSGEFIEGFLTE